MAQIAANPATPPHAKFKVLAPVNVRSFNPYRDQSGSQSKNYCRDEVLSRGKLAQNPAPSRV